MIDDLPFIYCNGDSYSDENYHSSLKGQTYINAIARVAQGFLVNSAKTGSNNRRIIRTTVYDMLEHRKLNPTQKTIAVLGLTFEIRGEIWVENLKVSEPKESQFKTHQFSEQINWRENLLNGQDIDIRNYLELEESFYKKYTEGRAYFFSPYAERINLLCDLIMLKKFLESLDIDFLVFQCPAVEKLSSDHLLDFFKNEIASDSRFLDLETFSFLNWCVDNQYTPLDLLDRPNIGHYGPDAHYGFATQLLIPKLKEQGVL